MRRHPWFAFALVQVVGAISQLVLPYAVGDLVGLPFLVLLAGLVLLLPGSLFTLALMRLVYPTPLAPRTEEVLAVLISVVVNGGIAAAIARIRWRPNFGLGFRRWLLAAGLGNATVLAFMCLWFPSAGLDGLFDRPHVQRVVASAVLTIVTIAVTGVSLLLRRGFQHASWIIVAIHFLRLVPATQAMDTWPGGDDGSGMGWAGIVLPFTWILALIGGATCLWCSRHPVSIIRQRS